MRKIEELDRHATPLGDVVLRRRWEPVFKVEVFEVKLEEEYLMSSLFVAGEVALGDLALASLGGDALRIVVAGLGLGYTARAVLDDDRVSRLHVLELTDHVIDWHERGLLPVGRSIAGDARAHLVQADFLQLLDPDAHGALRELDGLLIDVDHSPSRLLHPRHEVLYRPDGLRRLARRVRAGGAFALWSDDPPEDRFMLALQEVFDEAEAHVVSFDNPYTGGVATNTVYVARRG